MICRQNAEHYTWGASCDAWWLLRSNGLAVIEERMPAGASERRHLHTRSRQFFYVLAGELTMELEGRSERLQAGEGLEVVPGKAHMAANHSPDEVRFLVISQPPSHDDRHNL